MKNKLCSPQSKAVRIILGVSSEACLNKMEKNLFFANGEKLVLKEIEEIYLKLTACYIKQGTQRPL